MSIPLIYEEKGAVMHVGSMEIVEDENGIEISFKPINNVWMSSEAFNATKNRIVHNVGAAMMWDNSGKITAHIDACDPDRHHKISEIRKLVTCTYGVLLETNGLREEDALIQVAPGVWLLESDGAMAKLDKDGQRKLDEVLKEIFTERPLKMFISSPRGKEL